MDLGSSLMPILSQQVGSARMFDSRLVTNGVRCSDVRYPGNAADIRQQSAGEFVQRLDTQIPS